MNKWLQKALKMLLLTNIKICNYNRSLMQVASANSRKQGAMNYCTNSSVILLRDTAAGNCYSQITAAPNCQASKARHTEHAPPYLPCTSPLHLRGVTVQLTPRPVVYDWIVTSHANEHTAHACIQPPVTSPPT